MNRVCHKADAEGPWCLMLLPWVGQADPFAARGIESPSAAAPQQQHWGQQQQQQWSDPSGQDPSAVTAAREARSTGGSGPHSPASQVLPPCYLPSVTEDPLKCMPCKPSVPPGVLPSANVGPSVHVLPSYSILRTVGARQAQCSAQWLLGDL